MNAKTEGALWKSLSCLCFAAINGLIFLLSGQVPAAAAVLATVAPAAMSSPTISSSFKIFQIKYYFINETTTGLTILDFYFFLLYL